jgi:hypothetical protein
MLVEFSRAETSGPIAINPELAAAVFASSEDRRTIIRLADGRGFKVQGPLAQHRAHFPHMAMLERVVAVRQRELQPFVEGEDDGIVQMPAATQYILLAPQYIAAVFGSARNPGEAIIRMADGRGFRVRGAYMDLRGQLGVTSVEPSQSDGYQAARPEEPVH